MKKIIVGSSIAVLMVSALQAYAGPKIKVKKVPTTGVNLTRISRVSPAMLRQGVRYLPREIRTAAQHTPSQAAMHTHGLSTALPATPFTQAVTRQVVQAEKQISTALPPFRNRAEIPTRVQASETLEQARIRSKAEQNPNILVGAEVENSFARYKRNKLSKQLENEVKQLRAQDQSAASQERAGHYDGLREQEIKRYDQTRRAILERQIVQEDPKAQHELEPALNRHLDELDRINEAEIAERTRLL